MPVKRPPDKWSEVPRLPCSQGVAGLTENNQASGGRQTISVVLWSKNRLVLFAEKCQRAATW